LSNIAIDKEKPRRSARTARLVSTTFPFQGTTRTAPLAALVVNAA
jgi:hypothetical protein